MVFLMVVTSFVMIIMLLMVIVEKICGVRPSDVTKKCRRMFKRKRTVDKSLIVGNDEENGKPGPNRGLEEASRPKEGSRATEGIELAEDDDKEVEI